MRRTTKHKLWPEDEMLLAKMVSTSQSSNERKFFEEMRERMEWDNSIMGDLLLSAVDNEDGIFIERVEEDEFIVGRNIEGKLIAEEHVMNLQEALDINLKASGIADKDMTLLQWLQHRDYAGVRYDRNYDFI